MAELSPNTRPSDIAKIVPRWRPERDACLNAVRAYAASHRLVPPLDLDELESHTERILQESGLHPDHRGFLMVLLNNEIWRDTFAAIPYERRLLLLPQCLRAHNECPADTDEMGVLCRECGRCPIGEIQALAERLGYLVLVAEGGTLVVRLLESGKVDAVAGVSCLTALERSFPQTVANAIPSLAIPLYIDGCVNTKTDLDWVNEMIALAAPSGWRPRIDTESLRQRIVEWFEFDNLLRVLGPQPTRTERLAAEWLAKAGKRWRPLLVAAAYSALADASSPDIEHIRPLAIAVECFHKASLIHDDIEDDDDQRYGDPALHSQYGVPIAVNVGDLLLGEGYRLIAQSPLPVETRARLLAIAADAHRTLCIGQGEELDAARRDIPPASGPMLEIFRRKTAPAFAAALKFGAVAIGADDTVCDALDVFSDALGIAYQIRDDIADLPGNADAPPPRISILSALARECGETVPGNAARRKAEILLEHYRNEAVRSLAAFHNAELKSLLRRLLERLLESP